jgi:hypothetical protein
MGKSMMVILRPLAVFLVGKPLTIAGQSLIVDGGALRAVPAFNFYTFECASEPHPPTPRTPLDELKGRIQDACVAFPELQPVQAEVNNLADVGMWPFWDEL